MNRIPFRARFAAVCLLSALLPLLLAAPASARPPSRVDQVLRMNERAKNSLPRQVKDAAVRKHGLKAVALRQDFVKQHNDHYRFQVPLERKPHQARNQQGSGRCWAFASDKVFETKQDKAGQIPKELSKSFFNYHSLRLSAQTLLSVAAAHPRSSLNVASYLGEGAHQTRALKILEKHGAVPEGKMPTTADGANSGVFLNQMKRLMTRASRELARIKPGPESKTQTAATLKRYNGEIDQLLATTIGKPPRSFKVDGVTYTPRTYAQRVLGDSAAQDKQVVLIHDPSKSWNRRYMVKDLTGASHMAYNVSMHSMQRAVKRSIRSGEAVYFAANVSSDNPHRAGTTAAEPKEIRGVLSLSAFNYKPFVPEARLSKRDRVKSGISPANHAMVITGYDPTSGGGKVTKWKVDNSWGPAAGDQGHFHMYDDFFRQYVSKVQVPREAVPAAVLKKIESAPPVTSRAGGGRKKK